MSSELSIRFDRDELSLIAKALATQSDDDSRLLGIEIYKALNPEEVSEATPLPPAAEESEEDFVVRATTEQATFSDDSVVLRQRMSLHPIFGPLHPNIMQTDSFQVIFGVGNTISQCEKLLKDPKTFESVDGVPGNVVDRVRRQNS